MVCGVHHHWKKRLFGEGKKLLEKEKSDMTRRRTSGETAGFQARET